MKKLITLIIALAMAFVMALPAFAADNKTIYLPEKMSWMTAGTEARNYCDFRPFVAILFTPKAVWICSARFGVASRETLL